MPRPRQQGTPWREKRERRRATYDPKRKFKADRERHRRGKRSCLTKLNNFYLDALESGRDCKIYTVIMSKPKRPTCVRYTVYNSHPQENWVPQVDEVAEHWPKAEMWIPDNFKNDRKQIPATNDKGIITRRRLYKLSKPPALNLTTTPILS
ncbi:hypothetical protein RU639_013495 [Aspergillus parasiticus]